MKIQLGLTQKLLLLVTIPLLVEMVFLYTIGNSMQQAGYELKQQSQAVKTLVSVNSILNNVMYSSATVLLKRSLKDPTIYLEVEEGFKSLRQSTKQLHALNEQMELSSKDIKAFIEVIDEITDSIETYELSSTESYGINSLIVKEKLQSSLRKLKNLRDTIVDTQIKERELSVQRASELRENLRTAIEIGAMANLLLALCIALGVSMTFGKRLSILKQNTKKIAAGKELDLPIIEGRDELAEFDNVLHDLSAALINSRKHERAMIDNTAEIICSLDGNLRITEANLAVKNRLGYEKDEFLGANLQAYIHPDDKEETFAQLNKCKEENIEVSFNSRMKKNDGKFMHADWVAQWSSTDKNIFCVIHDITERKEAEQLKQEVVAMVSHDLRSPLTSIGVSLEILEEGRHGELTDRGKKVVKTGMVSVKSLISLVNDLIDIEKSEAGMLSLDVQPTDIETLVSNAINSVNPEAEQKDLILESNIEKLSMDVDRERTQRVLINLIGNAIKFSPKGKRIEIKAKSISAHDEIEKIRFEITDQGPGIPKDQLELVFEKFRQVGTRSAGEKKGSGLGLAICKELVIAHGGTIGVVSSRGEGSTFWFELPVKANTNNQV